jgi:outer membrane protein assembly factor BamB
MKGVRTVRAIHLLAFLLVLGSVGLSQNWPSFRGPHGSGISADGDPPVVWDAEKSTNTIWKTTIPGLGHSSPVVWGDRVFVTTAVSSLGKSDFVHGLTETAASAADVSRHRWQVFCLDRKTGRIKWQKTVFKGEPKVKRHVKASYANSTPATDGKHLVVLFGSEGLYCLDVNGKLLWKQDLGVLDGGWSAGPGFHWGFGSSPIIYRNLVIVQCDTQNQSFIAAYDISTGSQVWRTARREDTSWSTPTIYETDGRAELITSGTKYYQGYDPLNGKELWRLSDGADVKIPTPIAASGLYFLGGGSTQASRSFYAVRAGTRGEIRVAEIASDSGIAWRNPVIRPHVVTPIVYGDNLFVCTDNGILTQYNALSGEPGYRARLGRGGSFSASPVAAAGRLYFANEDGDVFVIKAGPQYELLAVNAIGEVVFATPAISGKMIIVRGQNHVFAFGDAAEGANKAE